MIIDVHRLTIAQAVTVHGRSYQELQAYSDDPDWEERGVTAILFFEAPYLRSSNGRS